jgi:hypothetical protein
MNRLADGDSSSLHARRDANRPSVPKYGAAPVSGSGAAARAGETSAGFPHLGEALQLTGPEYEKPYASTADQYRDWGRSNRVVALLGFVDERLEVLLGAILALELLYRHGERQNMGR